MLSSPVDGDGYDAHSKKCHCQTGHGRTERMTHHVSCKPRQLPSLYCYRHSRESATTSLTDSVGTSPTPGRDAPIGRRDLGDVVRVHHFVRPQHVTHLPLCRIFYVPAHRHHNDMTVSFDRQTQAMWGVRKNPTAGGLVPPPPPLH